MNVRGNYESMGHIKYSSTQSEFWNFTLDDMAKYDLPATIDFVLKDSNSEKLH